MSTRSEAWRALEDHIRAEMLATGEVTEDDPPEALHGDEMPWPRCEAYRCAGMRAPECHHLLTMVAC